MQDFTERIHEQKTLADIDCGLCFSPTTTWKQSYMFLDGNKQILDY